MEQDKVNLHILSLQDVEDCANRVMEKVSPDKKGGIRTKDRVLRDTLLCRYCYYKMARSIFCIEKKLREGNIRRGDFKFNLQVIISHINFKNHSNVVHGIRALNSMLQQKHTLAVERWEDMQNEIYKLVIKKDKDAKLTKRFLIGGI